MGHWMQALQRRAEKRLPALTRFRRPEALPIELHRRRIYIVPTAFGTGFATLLLVMMVGALNYTNNAALLLTCLLGAASITSMLLAFRALDGLQLQAIRVGNATAGQPIDLHLDFAAARARQAVRVTLDAQQHAFAIVARSQASVTFSLPTEQRGWQRLPRFRVWSSWPLGLFRAWSWLYPEQAMLVWPRPEAEGPAPDAPAEDQQRQRIDQGDDLAALREYRIGDPQRRIAWKASARHENLLVKDFERPQTHQEWRLDWRALRGLDNEARISRLARWLGEAHARRLRYSLWIPGQEIDAGSGAAHYARCMSALALLP